MSPEITRQPAQIENTIQQLAQAHEHITQRAIYHATHLTKQHLAPDHKLKPRACGEAKEANNDLLDHINATANMLALEYDALAQRLQSLATQLQNTENEHNQLEEEITTLIDKIKNIF